VVLRHRAVPAGPADLIDWGSRGPLYRILWHAFWHKLEQLEKDGLVERVGDDQPEVWRWREGIHPGWKGAP
jgi:hypothetical protein